MSEDKRYFTWDEIESLVEKLITKIQNLNRSYNSISTVTRGGLVPARLLADRLNIKKILVDKDTVPSDSLFVDDIYDSGETFEKVIVRSEDPDELVFATLVARKGKKYPKQLIFVQKTRGEELIVYPWDRFEYGLN